jgi:hypothetical protein
MTDPGDENDWSPSYLSEFGRVGAGFMPPKTEVIDRHPDKRPSASQIDWRNEKDGTTLFMDVRGEYGGPVGALVVRTSSGHATGKLQPEGLSLFTTEDILFDPLPQKSSEP